MISIFKLKSKIRRLVAYGLTMALILSFGFTNLIVYADDIVDEEGAGFSDIKGHWAKDQILSWSEKGLVTGYEDGTFGPERGVIRAEFITFINRAYGLVEKSGTSFSDVAAGDWFSDEVAKAVAAEYISGYDDGTMRPAAGISRLEAAVILYRLLRLTSPKSSVWVDGFMDSGSIAEWGKDQVNSAVAEGYLSGYPDGTFKPDNIITRAETVALLSKAVGVLYNAPGTYGPEGNGVIEGNVTVNVSGVTLKDLVIEGDLFLTAGIGDGDFNADGVTVKGRTIVGGGGRESIVFNNSSLGDVIVYARDGKVRVVAMGDTSIDDVILESGGFLQEENLTGTGFGGVQILVLKPGQEVELDGDFDWVSIETSVEMSVSGDTRIKELNVSEEADGTQINIGKDAVIDTLTLDGATDVTGKGTIKTANVNTDYYSFEKEPEATLVEDEEPEEDKKEEEKKKPGPSRKAVMGISMESPRETMLLKVGEDDTVIATVEPSNATNKKVTWSSSNTDVATVDINGVVTGHKGGYAAITATSVDKPVIKATKHVVVGDILVPAHFADPKDEGTIQGIIEDAPVNSVIVVAPGEYREQLEIDKPLTLLGPNAGIAGYDERNSEAVLVLPEFSSIHEFENIINVDSDEVIISGFKFDDEGRAAFWRGSWKDEDSGTYNMVGLYSGGNNINIYNNIFSGFSMAQLVASEGHYNIEGNYFKDSGRDTHYNTLLISNASARIENNKWSKSIGMRIQYSTDGGTIKGNTIDTIYRGIEFTAGSSAENWEIENNAFSVSPIPDSYFNPLTNWIGFESELDFEALEALMEVNTFDEGSQIIGNKIIVPEEGKVYNQRSGNDYETIQAAVNAADEGDTILVGPGEYDVTYLDSDIFKHYLWIDKAITIKAADMSNKPVLKAKYEEGRGKGIHQQATVHITADDVTLDGLRIHSIEDYGGWLKVVEITGANNATIQNCEIKSQINDNASVYLSGQLIGKYTITDNLLEGGIVPANGAGNATGGERSIISGNIINESISFTGKTNSGWDPNSFNVYPTIKNNIINGFSGLLINSRDENPEKLISDDKLNEIINNNTFPEGVVVVQDSYEYYGGELHRKRLMLNPAVYNETRGVSYDTLEAAVDDANH